VARVRYVLALIDAGFTVDAALQIAQHLDDGRAFCKVAGAPSPSSPSASPTSRRR
jgi:hypothetical protein